MIEEVEYDVFLTDPRIAVAGLRVLKDIDPNFYPSTVLDPGAGPGIWGCAAAQAYPDSILAGVDIRNIPKPDRYSIWYPKTDFLSFTGETYDLIVSNPPFSKKEGHKKTDAQLFVEHSWQLLNPGGYMIFYLRAAFLHGNIRTALFEVCTLRHIAALVQRQYFVGGRADAKTEYSLFFFHKGKVKETTISRVSWR